MPRAENESRKGRTQKGKKRESQRERGSQGPHSPPLRSPVPSKQRSGKERWQNWEGAAQQESVERAKSAGNYEGRRDGEKREELVIVTPAGNDARKGRQRERGNSTHGVVLVRDTIYYLCRGG